MTMMKILIAYDGSDCAKAALEDLKNAGFPIKAEALVLSVADVFVPPPFDEQLDNTFPMYVPEGVKLAHERAERKLKQAQAMAQEASERVKGIFPDWQVSYEAQAESPAWALISKADAWKADLIVMGAQGHSVLGGRLILGSVSQRVLYDASCSVRIARSTHRDIDSPLRLLIGVDNSSNSHTAVDAVYQRQWPAGTEVRLLTIVDTVMAVPTDPNQPAEMRWIGVADEKNWDQVRSIFQPSVDKLRSAGLDAAFMIRRGNPKDEIVEEAESWGAHCVFVGAKGMRGIDRLLLGSVSSAVSARAHCSVEVIREASGARIEVLGGYRMTEGL